METWLPALTLGLLGSLHCVGMCGPIGLALPVVNQGTLSRIAGVLSYNAGRVLTYMILGVVFGLLGKSFIIAGYQQALSITLGALILVAVLVPAKYLNGFSFSNRLFSPLVKLRSAMGRLFKQRSYSALFAIGLLNGLLPCGLVYTGIAGAIAVADPVKSSLFMMLFGLGTVPAMFGLILAGQKISLNWRNSFRKAVPVFVSVMAVLLILRGLNLGIPYISPELSKTDCTKHHCCHKTK